MDQNVGVFQESAKRVRTRRKKPCRGIADRHSVRILKHTSYMNCRLSQTDKSDNVRQEMNERNCARLVIDLDRLRSIRSAAPLRELEH